jgi:hypothetical protein
LIAAFLGKAVGGTIAIGILALIVNWILRKTCPKINKPLHISCVAAVLISILIQLSFWKPDSIDNIFAYMISGVLAFFLIRIRYKQWGENDRGIAEDTIEGQ